jgi:hypothetical protein
MVPDKRAAPGKVVKLFPAWQLNPLVLAHQRQTRGRQSGTILTDNNQYNLR